jgi:hypothetical protein
MWPFQKSKNKVIKTNEFYACHYTKAGIEYLANHKENNMPIKYKARIDIPALIQSMKDEGYTIREGMDGRFYLFDEVGQLSAHAKEETRAWRFGASVFFCHLVETGRIKVDPNPWVVPDEG